MRADNEMQTVQVAITSSGFAQKLRKALESNGNWRVSFVDTPDPQQEGVLVMDQCAFERMTSPLRQPGRVVLITRNESDLLARAWDAGILSVVLESDPAEIILLAMQSAAFRVGQLTQQCVQPPLFRRIARRLNSTTTFVPNGN